MPPNFCRFNAARPAALLTTLALLACAWPAYGSGWFEDVTGRAGVDFHYENGMEGHFYFPEIMGGGVALLDYDQDGLLDIYLVQAGAIGPGVQSSDRAAGDRLYRNTSHRDADGEWVVEFTDVTTEAGIDARGYGMGVAVGDYNGDGYPDIYVLNFGSNQLWRNNGDGTFTDVTDVAGVDDDRWSVSGSFADLDGDGLLDLVVVNYVDYTFENHQECRSAGASRQDYCSPSAYDGVSDSVFRNLGDGRFEDASARSGITSAAYPGLGVIAADFSGDGKTDIYVANDGTPNSLWINQGGFTFVDDAVLAGVAVNVDGAAEAGMGVDAADYNRSGNEDIFVTHLRRETNTLYRNDGDGWFTDITSRSGLGAPSLSYTGFGTAWMDIDNDGWLDLVVANGAVTIEERFVEEGHPFPYAQGNQLFKNEGDGHFVEATVYAGDAFREERVSRGLAVGDIDNDGRPDVVLVNTSGPARVLMNRSGPDQNWLGLRLVDASGQRDLVGSVAWLMQGDEPLIRRRSRTDGSYASANDPRILFGLAGWSAPATVRVHWPGGVVEQFCGLAVNAYHTLERGTGQQEE